MILSEIKEVYIESFKQLRVSWAKLLAWNGIWALFCVIVIHIFYNRILQILMGVNAGAGSIVLFAFLTFISSILVWSFGLYSLLGIPHEIERDPNCSWVHCGIQGFLHPFKAVGVSVVSLALSFVFSLIICGIAFLIPAIGSSVLLIYFIVLVGWAYFYMFVVMSYFAQLDNEVFAPLKSAQMGFYILKGSIIKTFVSIIPIVLICLFFLELSVSFWAEGQTGKMFDFQLAMSGRQMVLEDQAGQTKNKHQFTGFSHQVPEYDGDFDKYVQDMAEYAFLYEGYKANIEKRPMNEMALKYRDDHPVDHSAKIVISFIFGCLSVGCVAFLCVLLLQIYRHKSKEYEEAMNFKVEETETEEDIKKMEMLKKHLQNDSKNGNANVDPNAVDSGKHPALIMKKRVCMSGGENNKVSESIVGMNDDKKDAQVSVEKPENAFVFEREKKGDSIDMNFSLDVAAFEKTLENETASTGKKRRKVHNSVMNCDGIISQTENKKEEESLFDTGEGSLCNTLESLLDGFSKDDVDK